MIPEEVIQDIKDSNDIVDVIGSVISLRRSGRNYKALCPFHKETAPSFIVSPDKQIFHCFGCHKGGNVIHFLMEYEGIGFVDALRKLGRNSGIDVDEYIKGTGEQRSRYERFYNAMEFAANFYSKALKGGGEAKLALQYIEDRGVSSGTVEEFSLGFAPGGWENLYKAATKEGISLDVLMELDLVRKNKRGGGQHDYFRNRLIFPIKTLSNRYVGLAGRVLDDSEPKYLNSSESPIYSKGKILYGLTNSRDRVLKEENVILVEGYMDYLMLWEKGIRNVAAVCGTSLTKEQSGVLARFAKGVYIINDGDEAGMRAAIRAADQLIDERVKVRIVKLPKQEDPDSFVTKFGAEALREKMRSAPNYFRYLKEEAEKGKDRTYRRSKVINHLLNSIGRVRDEIQKELYYQEISELFKVPVDILRKKAVSRTGIDRGRGKTEKLSGSPDRREEFQKIVFRIALESEKYSEIVLDEIDEEVIKGKVCREFYKSLDIAVNSNIDLKGSEFLKNIDDPDLSKYVSEIALMELPPGPVEKYLLDTLDRLKEAWLSDKKLYLKEKLNQLEQDGKSGSREAIKIVEDYRDVTKKLKSFCPGEERESDES